MLELTAIDFETTGSVPGYPNEPWQIGLCALRWDFGNASSGFRGAPASAPASPIALPGSGAVAGSWLRVAADRPFNRHAPERHAQIRDRLAAAPTLTEAWPDLGPRLSGKVLVAHNIGTERSQLADTFPLHRFGPWIDTLKLARAAWPDWTPHALEVLIPELGLRNEVERICPGLAPHDARYDAVACGILLRHLAAQPGWRDLRLEDWLQLSER